MDKHAADLARVMDDADIGRAPIIGVSIGGYILFEFWRRSRNRVAALGLCNTKAPADGAEARAGRLQAANDVLERGTEPFLESMVQKVFAKTTRENRPDLVDGALRMMRKMSPEDIAQVQRGMAERPDSVDTLKTINVPTLLYGRRRHADRRQRSRTHAPAHLRKPVAHDPQSRTLLPLGATTEAARLLRQFLDNL